MMQLESGARGEETDEREMMNEMRDNRRAAAESATVLTHNSFHFADGRHCMTSPFPSLNNKWITLFTVTMFGLGPHRESLAAAVSPYYAPARS